MINILIKKIHKNIIFLIHTIFFIIGILIFKDFGVGLEEMFHKASGFYWLGYLSDLLNLENLKILANNKYNELYMFNPNLPKVESNSGYGIVFDVPMALLEILLNFKYKINNLYLKHFFNFLFFFISSIFFSLILKNRYSNFYVTFFGSLAYFLSPKIFGASFFDGKDLIFLSIFTISIYFFQKFIKKNHISDLIIFSIFSAISTSSRIFGIIIPISFILILFFKILSNDQLKNNLKIMFIFLVVYFSFLFFHWPYLWNIDFNYFYRGANHIIFFAGNYYNNIVLPKIYIPKLIFITTPVFIIFLFIIGFFLVLKRSLKKLIFVRENKNKIYLFDFWRSKGEMLDFFVLICMLLVILSYFSFNTQIYSSWRHYMFFHFFLIYFFSYSIYFVFFILKKKILNFFYFLIFLFNLNLIYNLFIFHPYQYNYFNTMVSNDKIYLYERDTSHLSRIYAIRDVLEDIKNKKIKKSIFLATASWSPLEEVGYFFSEKDLSKIIFTGNSNLENADYIFTNYIYELNPKYSNKYNIPKNFYLYKSIYRDGILMYSLFKKK